MPHASSSDTEFSFSIQRSTDAVYIAHHTKTLLARWGFPKAFRWQLAIAISETATNIIKYGEQGEIRISYLQDPIGVEFEAVDQGAGFQDLPLAMKDGISQGQSIQEVLFIQERNGMGFGLGAIQRMVDHLTIQNRPGGGTYLMAQKYLLPQSQRKPSSSFSR